MSSISSTAVAGQIRPLRVQSYLATTSDNVFDAHGAIKDAIRNRAEIYNCRILTAATIRQLAVDPDDIVLIRGTFFARRPPAQAQANQEITP